MRECTLKIRAKTILVLLANNALALGCLVAKDTVLARIVAVKLTIVYRALSAASGGGDLWLLVRQIQA